MVEPTNMKSVDCKDLKKTKQNQILDSRQAGDTLSLWSTKAYDQAGSSRLRLAFSRSLMRTTHGNNYSWWESVCVRMITTYTRSR